MEDAFAVSVFGFMLGTLSQYLEAIFGALMGTFGGVIRTAVTLYVIIVGYKVLMGSFGGRTKEAAVSIFLVVLLQGMVMESSLYMSWVVVPIKHTVLSLTSFFVSHGQGGDLTSLFVGLDDTIGKLFSTLDKIEPSGNFITMHGYISRWRWRCWCWGSSMACSTSPS